MGLRFRKSVKICKGVRLNFGKSGASLSFGSKGFRYSIHTSGRRTASVGIPGTGIYYSQSVGGGTRKYKSTAYKKKQQIQNQKIAQQKAKQDQIQENALLVAEYENYLDLIRGVHKECEPAIDWKSILNAPPPYQSGTKGPRQLEAEKKYNNFSPNLFEKIFHIDCTKRKQKLYDAIKVAIEEDCAAYNNWDAMHQFAESILDRSIDAYLTAISESNPFEDLLEYGSDFEFGTDDSNSMTVEFRVKGNEVVPSMSLSLTKTGMLSKKALTKTQYFDYLQDYVCSCAIRVARELFSVLPLDTVIVHAVDQVVNTVTGHNEDVTILSVRFTRERFNNVNFDQIDPSDFVVANEYNMKFYKTTGFKPIERLS